MDGVIGKMCKMCTLFWSSSQKDPFCLPGFTAVDTMPIYWLHPTSLHSRADPNMSLVHEWIYCNDHVAASHLFIMWNVMWIQSFAIWYHQWRKARLQGYAKLHYVPSWGWKQVPLLWIRVVLQAINAIQFTSAYFLPHYSFFVLWFAAWTIPCDLKRVFYMFQAQFPSSRRFQEALIKLNKISISDCIYLSGLA